MRSVPSRSANKPHDSDYSRNRARSIRFLIVLLVAARRLLQHTGRRAHPRYFRPGIGREDQPRHPQQPPAAHLHCHGRRRGAGAGRVHSAGRAAQSAGLGLHARRIAGRNIRRSRRHHRPRPESGRQLGHPAVLLSRLAARRGRHSGASCSPASPSAPC